MANWYDMIGGQPGDPMAGSEWYDVDGSLPPLDSHSNVPDWTAWMPGNTVNSSNAGGSFIQKLLGNGQGMADISSLIGSFSKGEKSNRLDRANLTQNYDQLMLRAQAERNANESDALKKLAQTSYLSSGGSQFKLPTIQLGGQMRTLPDFGFGPRPASDAQKQGASTLQAQLLQRLKPGGSYTPTDLNSYANPGLAEKIGSYGALGTGGVGAIDAIMHPQQSGSSFLDTLTKAANLAKTGTSIAKLLGLFGGD